MHGSKTRIKNWEKAIYLFAFAVLVVLRMPAIFTKGRFWAEEGAIFFANAWCSPWYKALFAIYGGYINICANIAAVLANYLVPLEYACYVTSIFALCIQLLPGVLLCTSKQSWLQDRRVLIASLLLVAVLPFSYEVWISSIGSQCHLNLCTVIILALESVTGTAEIFRCAVLVLAALSGPGPMFLLPLFVARAAIERSKPRTIEAVTLGLASAVQIAVCLQAPQRHVGISPILLVNTVFVKHVLEPFIGQAYSWQLTVYLHDLLIHGYAPIALMIITITIFTLFGIAAWRAGNTSAIWFFFSGLLLSALSYVGALCGRGELMYAGNSARYAFAPQISFELALLCLASVSFGWTRSVSQALVVWLLVIGLHDYFFVPTNFSDGPSWPAEVRAWYKNPERRLNIWPATWYVLLNHHSPLDQLPW